MSLYGFERETTPHLTEWAKRGVCFDRAVAPSPWTLPSHASFFTGHMPHELFTDWTRMETNGWALAMDNRFPTLAELLAARGYRTGGFVANWCYGDRVFGLNRGFAHYDDLMVFDGGGLSVRQVIHSSYLTRTSAEAIRTWAWPKLLPTLSPYPAGDDVPFARKQARHVNQEFLHWLDKDPERPFFAFLNYMDAHEPYARHDDCCLTGLLPEIDESLPDPSSENSSGNGMLADEPGLRLANRRANYEASLAYLDWQIGLLLDDLESRHLLDSTLVIITSDHGEQFGEHGRKGHANSLYMQLLHVPLIVLYPGHLPAGLRFDEPVSLANLPATVLDMLHLPSANRVPGKSLARAWSAPARGSGPPEPVMSELLYRHPALIMRSVIRDGYHYIVTPYLPKEELYDWIKDPHEEHDLAKSPEQQDRLKHFASLLGK
jgi:arylsulfatase A-like enzyme